MTKINQAIKEMMYDYFMDTIRGKKLKMIDNIEKATSSRSVCRGCGKKILKQTPRGFEMIRRNNHTEKAFYCWRCCEKILKNQIIMTKITQRELKNLKKSQAKHMILDELEDEKNKDELKFN